MSDAATATKKKAPAKPKKVATHPVYSEMIKAAISSLKERGGSSRQAILKYILKNYNVGTEEKKINAHLKLALKSGVTKGILKQSKGTGAAGSFRIGDSAKADKPKKAAKPKAAAKKPAAKKPAAKKAKSTPKKKPAAAKKAKATPKKAAAKKPATKKAAKPAAKKATPKKKAAAKKPAAKKAAKK